MTTIATIFLLLVLFQLKHYVADYLLQNKYMLGKFKPDWSFALPLFAHAGVHGCFTLAICLAFAPQLWWLSLVDTVTHFVVDRIKAGPRYLGKFKALSADEFKEVAFLLNQAADFEAHPEKYEPGWDDYVAEFKNKSLKKVKSNTVFWWALGLDQMTHHLLHYLFIACIIGVL